MLKADIVMNHETDVALEVLFLNAAVAARQGLLRDAIDVGWVARMAKAICDLAYDDLAAGMVTDDFGLGLSGEDIAVDDDLSTVLTGLTSRCSHCWQEGEAKSLEESLEPNPLSSKLQECLDSVLPDSLEGQDTSGGGPKADRRKDYCWDVWSIDGNGVGRVLEKRVDWTRVSELQTNGDLIFYVPADFLLRAYHAAGLNKKSKRRSRKRRSKKASASGPAMSISEGAVNAVGAVLKNAVRLLDRGGMRTPLALGVLAGHLEAISYQCVVAAGRADLDNDFECGRDAELFYECTDAQEICGALQRSPKGSDIDWDAFLWDHHLPSYWAQPADESEKPEKVESSSKETCHV